MKTFAFRAIDGAGRMRRGRERAASTEELQALLRSRSLRLVESRPVRASALRGAAGGDDVLALLTEQLASLLGAGIPLDRALALLGEGQPRRLADTVDALRERVRGGARLSDALEESAQFPPFYVAMARAGEASGDLGGALARLDGYRARSAQLSRAVIAASIYPAILMLTVAGALAFLLAYVVPQFADLYASMGAPVPAFTRLVMSLGLFLRRWLLLLVAGVAALALLVSALTRVPVIRARVDASLMRARGLRNWIARVEMERYLRALGTLLTAGVHLLPALRTTSAVVGNAALRERATALEAAVREGQRLSAAFVDSGIPLQARHLQLIRTGEEAGRLGDMMLRAADGLDAEVRSRLDVLMAALVPMVTILMFGLIGLVVISILVPLYDLTAAIQ